MKAINSRSLLLASVISLASTSTPAFDTTGFMAAMHQEPRVKDVAIDHGTKTIYVGVINNGSDRTDYAKYICTTVARKYAEKGDKKMVVDVIDVIVAAERKRLKSLGKSNCKM